MLLLAHSDIVFAAALSWILTELIDEPDTWTVVSSANIVIELSVDRANGRSLMWIMNNRGPTILPCGIPTNERTLIYEA